MNKTVFFNKFRRLFGFVLTISLLGNVFAASAQNARISIKMENVPISQVIKEIENQTRYLFINKGVDTKNKVSINAVQKTIQDVLAQLFAGTEIAYRIDESYIILTKKNDAGNPVSVTGKIRDAKGNPIVGASILVQGTTIGVSSDADGAFALQVPPPAADRQLEISFIGYTPVSIVVGSRTSFEITLEEAASEIEQVVVTALGIKRSEKAVAYNVQQIKAEDITTVKDANFINSLTGKVAGVTINASSSGVGGASKVVLRGNKSISQSSNALYVIDGIPMYNFGGGGGTEFDSRGATESIADLNPEDIESMSVLTGAAAAALYGSEAANGAVMITTKKGQAGTLKATFSSNIEFLAPFIQPEFQNRYGTGLNGQRSGSSIYSWGEKLRPEARYGYTPDDYFETGHVYTNAVTVSGGTDKNQTYFSAASVNSDGIIPNNEYDRYNFTFRNTSYFLKDRLKLDASASYIYQKDQNMTNQGVYSNPLVPAYLFPRGENFDLYRRFERYNEGTKLMEQFWSTDMEGGDLRMQNPYWINYRNLRNTDKKRYMLSFSASYDILPWLNVAGRVRLDNSNSLYTYTEKMYASSNVQLTEQSANGLYGVTKTMDRQVYGDALLNINKTFGDDWSLQANIGASFSDMKNDALKIRGPIADGTSGEKQGLANVFNIQNLSNSTKTVRKQEGWREQTQSIFASAEVGYKGTYYLTLTGRNDWPSQLAGPHSNAKSFFYPSVGLSVVLSQLIPNMPENLSYIKLRGSFASVGVAFERYIANPLYSWNESGLSWNTQTQYPAYHLKPERTKSFEVGLTMRFLKHFNLDFTYYNSHTSNQTFDPQISGGTGFSKIIIQSGNVRNQGIELALGYRNTWRDFTWDTNYTLSTNQNKIVSLANNVINYATGERFSIDRLNMGGLGDALFLLQEGGTLGDLYSRRDLRYDENNAIYIDENGNVATETIQDVKKYVKLGSVLPDANMSWRNDFRWKNLNFGFMVAARLGGIVYSRTQAMLDQYGVSEATAAARDAGGVTLNGGDVVDAYTWYSAIAGGNSIPQFYTYSATNVRLQEASIGYTIPREVLRNVCEITVSIVGRNLWMLYNKAPFDPESIATTGNYYQGIDYFMMPSLRNVGFNLRFKF